MRNTLIRLIMLCLPVSTLAQQNIQNILNEIESNNSALIALRELNQAQKLEYKTGIYLENPQVEFNYLWGDPAIGNRKDFGISQSFDFPTAYGHRKKVSEKRGELSDLEYQLQRAEILYQAKNLCNHLVYVNAKQKVLGTRKEHAESLAIAYELKFESGETNILERNKAKLSLLNAVKELESNSIEREELLSKLIGMNGGKIIEFSLSDFETINLPADFDGWYAQNESQNILLEQSSKEVEVQEQHLKLSKALGLPKFSTGYMSESVVGESFKGVTLGMSIPLWENKNTVKLAHARQKVAEEVAGNVRLKTYNRLKTYYEKAVRLNATLLDYKELLQSVNSSDLLKKALDAGELSLIDYTIELSIYYETVDAILATENELQQALSALHYFEL